jgi:hypothetical protein
VPQLPLYVGALFRSPAAPLDSMIDWVADRLAHFMTSLGKETRPERRFFMAAAGATPGNAKPTERKWGQ